jgi:hypothetical protein
MRTPGTSQAWPRPADAASRSRSQKRPALAARTQTHRRGQAPRAPRAHRRRLATRSPGSTRDRPRSRVPACRRALTETGEGRRSPGVGRASVVVALRRHLGRATSHMILTRRSAPMSVSLQPDEEAEGVLNRDHGWGLICPQRECSRSVKIDRTTSAWEGIPARLGWERPSQRPRTRPGRRDATLCGRVSTTSAGSPSSRVRSQTVRSSTTLAHAAASSRRAA